MKKYLSVLGLIARNSVYEIIGTVFLMALAEFILFCNKLKYELRIYDMDISMANLETILDRSMLGWCFTLGFIIITLALCLTGTEYRNTKTNYTIRRLAISEREFFFCQAAYNTFIYIILWVAQTVIVFGLCMWYQNQAPEEFLGNQTVFLAFYRNKFIHSLLPLSEVSLWVRNFLIAIGLGFAAAEFPYKQRRHKNAVTILAFAIYVIIYFSQDIGNAINVFIVILVTAAIIGETLYTVLKQDEEEIIENEKV